MRTAELRNAQQVPQLVRKEQGVEVRQHKCSHSALSHRAQTWGTAQETAKPKWSCPGWVRRRWEGVRWGWWGSSGAFPITRIYMLCLLPPSRPPAQKCFPCIFIWTSFKFTTFTVTACFVCPAWVSWTAALPHPTQGHWGASSLAHRMRSNEAWWNSFLSLGFTQVQNWEGKAINFPMFSIQQFPRSGGSTPHRSCRSRVLGLPPFLTSPLPLPPTPSQWKKRNKWDMWDPKLLDTYSDHRERLISPQLLSSSPLLRLLGAEEFYPSRFFQLV